MLTFPLGISDWRGALDSLSIRLPVRPSPWRQLRAHRRAWLAVTLPLVMLPVLARLWGWTWIPPGMLSWGAALMLIVAWIVLGVVMRDAQGPGTQRWVSLRLTGERLIPDEDREQSVLLESIRAVRLSPLQQTVIAETVEGERLYLPGRLRLSEADWLRRLIEHAAARRRQLIAVDAPVGAHIPPALRELLRER